MLKLKVLKSLPLEAVEIDNTTPLANISAEMLASPVIILRFPSFMDGRAYSQARWLRRMGFIGELVATGDIRADQARQYARVGFSSLYCGKDVDQQVLNDDLERYPHDYQKSSFGSAAIYEQRSYRNTDAHLSGGGSFTD